MASARLVRLAREQQVRPALDVRLEVAGVEHEVHLPGARSLLVLLELAVEAGEVQQRLAVGRAQADHLAVLRDRACERLVGLRAGGLDLLELREDQVRVGLVLVERDRGARLLRRLVEPAHLAQQPRGSRPGSRTSVGSSFCALRYSASAASTLPASRACRPRLKW